MLLRRSNTMEIAKLKHGHYSRYSLYQPGPPAGRDLGLTPPLTRSSSRFVQVNISPALACATNTFVLFRAHSDAFAQHARSSLGPGRSDWIWLSRSSLSSAASPLPQSRTHSHSTLLDTHATTHTPATPSALCGARPNSTTLAIHVRWHWQLHAAMQAATRSNASSVSHLSHSFSSHWPSSPPSFSSHWPSSSPGLHPRRPRSFTRSKPTTAAHFHTLNLAAAPSTA